MGSPNTPIHCVGLFLMQPQNTKDLLRLVQSSQVEDKWKGLVIATNALRNWTEEEILQVLESIGSSFLISLLQSNERQLREMGAVYCEKMDLISLSVSLLSSSCMSQKVCQGSFWSELLPHLAHVVYRESKQVRDGCFSEVAINGWITICSVCSVQQGLLRWFTKNTSLQRCMIEFCKNLTRSEATTNNLQRQEQWKQLVIAMSSLALVLCKTREECVTSTEIRKLLIYIVLVTSICFGRVEEPSFSLDMVHQLYRLSPYFGLVFGNDMPRNNLKTKVCEMDVHLRNGLQRCLSNRLNDELRQKLFSILVEEFKLWKLYQFEFTENISSSISSLWKYIRFLLFMCSVELGVHLREVLRVPNASIEIESNREIHLVNVFQLLELSIELFQQRMEETDESPEDSLLRADEVEEVQVMEALVENIQVVVEFLEAEPVKYQNDDSQFTRSSKYFIVALRLTCCFCSLKLPVLEERISTVLLHSWIAILDHFDMFLSNIDWDTFHDLISWTSFGVGHLVEYSEAAVKTFEQGVFSKVWIKLLQVFTERSSIISTITDTVSISQCIHDIIELLICLYVFPCNRSCINDHREMLVQIQRQWPSEKLAYILSGNETAHVVSRPSFEPV